ncbi:MAG: zinc-binding dehydrogenase [Alphaproteobacteria bacterium]
MALPSAAIAVVPDTVSDADAATLPVAGLTALYCLERCDRLLASRVLVTGASGGVGWFACQLGRLMGADVVGLLRRDDQAALVRTLGIAGVVVSADGSGLEPYGRFRAVIDGVGGAGLGPLLARLDEGGRAILYGVSAGAATEFAIRDLMATGDGRIEGFHLYRESEHEAARKGLDRLLGLLATGRLRTLVSVTAPWRDVGAVAARLIERDFPGKAVLTL